MNDRTVKRHMRRGHHVKGYLYFDFLVTGTDGSVDQTSTVNNSYHVTWKTSQRSRGPNDGPVRTYDVVAQSDDWAYDANHATVDVGLYGEWEPRRPLPGDVSLANGVYNGVQFRLTEESFHSGAQYGGNWRTVMVANGLSFVIGGGGTETHDVAVTGIRAPGRPPRPGQTKSVNVTVHNEGTVEETTDVTLTDLTDAAAIVGPASQPATVAPGASVTVEFNWIPAVKGNHTLEAFANPVPDETDTDDNVLSKTIKVR